MSGVRWWSADAKSGVVVGELPALQGVDLTVDLAGGQVSAWLPVDPLIHTRLDVDWAEAGRRHQLVQPGARTLVATIGETPVGEWLITRVERSTDATTLRVQGVGWEQYPRYRSLHTDYVYETPVSQMDLARALWQGAYHQWNDGMQMLMPANSSTVTRTMRRLMRTGYYSDALTEISTPDDGFEWIVEISGEWWAGELQTVSRQIVVGEPVLARPAPLVLEYGAAGTRHGNVLSVATADDWTRYATWVVGVGAGQGDRQLLVQLEGPASGLLKSVRNQSFPEVTDLAILTALTRAEVTASQSLREPYTIRCLLDPDAALAPVLPKPGTVVRMLVARCPAWPSGLDVLVRIGVVRYTDLDTGLPTMTISAI